MAAANTLSPAASDSNADDLEFGAIEEEREIIGLTESEACNKSIRHASMFRYLHRETDGTSDVKIQFQGYPRYPDTYAHKYVLFRSPECRDRLNTSRILYPNQTVAVIKVDVEHNLFTELLRFLYYDRVRVNMQNANEILRVAKDYKVPGLTKACEEYLIGEINPTNVCRMLETDLVFHLQDLSSKCMAFIAKNAGSVLRAADLARLPKHLLHFILEQDQIDLREVDLFGFCMRWAIANPWKKSPNEGLRTTLAEMFNLVRFPTMTIDEFANEVVPLNVLTDVETCEIFKYMTCRVKPPPKTTPFSIVNRQLRPDDDPYPPKERHGDHLDLNMAPPGDPEAGQPRGQVIMPRGDDRPMAQGQATVAPGGSVTVGHEPEGAGDGRPVSTVNRTPLGSGQEPLEPGQVQVGPVGPGQGLVGPGQARVAIKQGPAAPVDERPVGPEDGRLMVSGQKVPVVPGPGQGLVAPGAGAVGPGNERSLRSARYEVPVTYVKLSKSDMKREALGQPRARTAKVMGPRPGARTAERTGPHPGTSGEVQRMNVDPSDVMIIEPQEDDGDNDDDGDDDDDDDDDERHVSYALHGPVLKRHRRS